MLKVQELEISSHQSELKALENNIMGIREQILNLDNLVSRNKERINFNQERIKELARQEEYFKSQIEQTKARLKLDEEKLNNIRKEYGDINKTIEEKTNILREKEEELSNINLSTKTALENIAKAKKDILELVSKIAGVRNDITDASSKQQIHLARKKRLGIENAKLNEEKATTEEDLKDITREVEDALESLREFNLKIVNFKDEIDKDSLYLEQIKTDIEGLEREKLTLESQKEFLDKLKTKYEDISESMNAVIYLDKLPPEDVSGLVVKVKGRLNLTDKDKADFESASIKLSGEAKPIDLDTQKVAEQINRIEAKISALKNTKISKEAHLQELNKLIQGKQQEARNFEMVAVNKKAQAQTILEQFNKLKEEEDIIILELSDVQNENSILETRLTGLKSHLDELDKEHKTKEELISNEQNNVSLNTNLREKTLVLITQTKTELEALTKRIAQDEATLKILEDTYQQDEDSLLNLREQVEETLEKQEKLQEENKDLENSLNETTKDIQSENNLLKDSENKHKEISGGTGDAVKKIELQRKELDGLKNKLYELQMQNKDIEFKILSIKERILQSYKINLDTADGILGEIDGDTLSQEIGRLKEKLDSYGTVNLVAIEEYDELKKRYDFLNQQDDDLLSAKESLHEAILKINRTAKKMFLETFEKVREEFRNYFRLLFNGGDAQLFLIDEQDPLESGIEIICRPPGKKLQNVLLLSGGEKSMSAIALIFAIFKVKPSPFCVLDEIDAALDEANVDRFARMLQEFTKDSQFIVITHNKKTIANADVMYGITMEESGVSKIVSVKFAQNKAAKSEGPPVAVVQ
jgi:chromosome segregation protein